MKLRTCHCCGEKKEKEEFYLISHFTRVQHKKVQWCRDCQKMYLEYKKANTIREKIQTLQAPYEVAFE